MKTKKNYYSSRRRVCIINLFRRLGRNSIVNSSILRIYVDIYLVTFSSALAKGDTVFKCSHALHAMYVLEYAARQSI